ncbi:HAD hydrolase family protein [Mycoplasmopsis felis]|uniref:HAD family hydrolase n=1 Tax=Mycoplasmopsis felis TaxID=33923 RepID=UPI0021AF96E2|nr:HAD hydrolase family protein [Mycoplasmopsis felis]UWV79146.1 HAD hydrolase family protein [Mycoplasmopsis felis]
MKKEEIKEIKKPKIIFIDLDGTTLDGPGEKFWQKEATEYTKNVINKLQKSIPVIVSTGRGVNPKTQAIVNSFGSSTYIAWNGAKTVINGEVAHSNSIPKEIANELFEEIKNINVLLCMTQILAIMLIQKIKYINYLWVLVKKQQKTILNIIKILNH